MAERGYPMRLLLFSAMVLTAGVIGSAAFTAAADASEGIASFTTTTSTTQAGGHPDLSTSFTLESPGVPDAAQNVIFNAPEGIFGNPFAVTHCTSSDFVLDECPSNSQVGIITVRASYEGNPAYVLGTAPIFDIEPGEGQTALFAFIVPTLNIPINIPVAVRTTSDYGLRFTVQNITQLTPLSGAELTFWGFPADSTHDEQRFPKGIPGDPAGCVGKADTSCVLPTSSSIPVKPLTDNPTTCSGQQLTTSLTVQTYQDPAHPTTVEGSYPATTACDLEVFNPVLFASPTVDETDAPSGLDIRLSAPQFLGRAASPSELRAATVTLPEGLNINPDAADGQTACSDDAANFDSEGPAECPDSSKIGTFEIETKALPGPLTGSIYIGEPRPGNQYRMFEVASGFGVNAKLVGAIRPDPQTGRVTADFSDLPQAPFDVFKLHLFASDRGLMATPTRCRVYETQAIFYPWNSVLAEQESTQNFALGSGPHGSECPGEIRPFHPTLAAGTSNPGAGGFSSFTLKLDREDGDQFLGNLNFTMPPGLTASLRGLSYCPDAAIQEAAQKLGRAEQATPSCPLSSQIGTTNVAAGPGSHPFHAVGRMYLAGPFKGAPLSVVAVTPALAGPYDYGTVVVRVAIHVDPIDAHVVAVSDTVPSIIGGVPIRLRSIQVNIDKPNFMINPTNCNPFSVLSEGVGDQGTAASFSSYFNAVNCGALKFKPKLTVKQLGGKGETARSKNPGMRFDLTTRPGDANIKSVAVTLPKAFEIDQRHLANICSKSQLERERCAGRQAIGTVITETPLLDAPLTGPAYAVSGFGKLPRVVFILSGQVTVTPEALSSAVRGGHLKTVVPNVPDVPIGHFRLTLFGGKKGYLVNTRDLCSGPSITEVELIGQNGASRSERAPTTTACGRAKTH